MNAHTKESLLAAWANRPTNITSPTKTNDPVLLAGAYIEWASGDVSRALHVMRVHASGQYLDMPRFQGCDEAVALLAALGIT